MDVETLAAYDRDAAEFAKEWEQDQSPPVDLREIVTRFFGPGPTADIGCGSGRDTAWLHANRHLAVGYDPSSGLLAQARRLHPEVEFHQDSLPELAGLADGSLANVLCETVIMHLEPAALAPALARLIAVLRPGGTLYLSWRVTPHHNRRDDHGRLYAAFDADSVRNALAAANVMLDEESTSASSGKTIHRIIARRY
ncbi:MAG TPA: class I SAM-dependent methyltransferase [Pseudonocardia sp.]|nr:class I SAM-dependent methyltransferase [Pseudonocardia sp.]